MSAEPIRLVESHGVTFSVPAGRNAAFWDLVAAGRWEPETFDVLARHLGPHTRFVDVGAWIGPLTLWAAAAGADVVAYEPDPNARAALEANLACNPGFADRVTVLPVALGAAAGAMTLSGGGHGLGASESRLVEAGTEGNDTVTVEVVDAAAEAARRGFGDADLLKIDIEGSEFVVVPRLRDILAARRVPLLLSMHGYDLPAASRRRRRGLRSVRRRARQMRRSVPVFRALAGYPSIEATRRDSRAWAPQGWADRVRLCATVREYELYCATGPVGASGPAAGTAR